MNNLKHLLCLLILAIGVPAFAQDEAEVIELARERVRHKVAQLNDNISFMASKSKDLKTRNFYKRRALDLFIGKGGPFKEDTVTKKGVVMETTTLYRKKPTRRLMTDYFTGLINLKYKEVDIQSTNVYEIEVDAKPQKIDDNTYVCSAYFDQIFVGHRDRDLNPYTDLTRKKVTVYIIIEEVIDGKELRILLGDVKALDTKRL